MRYTVESTLNVPLIATPALEQTEGIVKKDVRSENASVKTPRKTSSSRLLEPILTVAKTSQVLETSRGTREKSLREQNAILAQTNRALHTEIVARQRAEKQTRLLLKIIQAIGETHDFPSSVGLALQMICDASGWDYAEAWTPRAEGAALECSPACYQRSKGLETFRSLSKGFIFAPNIGLPGRVWASKRPEWVEDMSIDPLEKCPRAEIALQAGLKAAFGVPILAGEQVLAVLVFFTSESRKENERQVELALAVASQLGSILQRKQVEQGLRQAREELEVRVRERTAELTKANETLQAEIAERKKAGAWLHSLIETTQDAVISIDRQGRVVSFNPAAERIFGYGKSEIQGKKVNVLMAQAYATELDSYIERYEKTGEPRAIGRIRTVAARRKNGEVFQIELSVAEVTSAESEEVRCAAFIRDISDKARLQEQLVESERLAAIGTTMSVFAHEVGNPINSMFVTAQLLERYISRAEDKIDGAAMSAIKRLKNEFMRLSHLLHDFRSLSQRKKYNFRPISLATLVGEIYALEADQLRARGIGVEQSFPPDLPQVLADRDTLAQALLNLCENASEAMPEGGTLSCKANKSGDQIVLEIRDTGIGIPKKVDIFKPFVTTKKTGTGLGLMIVRQIVSAHGGTIGYSSEPDKGTVFRMSLPVYQPPARPPPRPPGPY
jgi:two-component system sensor kinase FixL